MAAWLPRDPCRRGQWTRQRRLSAWKETPRPWATQLTGQNKHQHQLANTDISSVFAWTFPKRQAPPKPGAKHCIRSAKNQLDRGPLTTPKPLLAVDCSFQNQGAKRFGRSASGITRPFAHQKKLDRGPPTTPKQPLAPPLALPTPAENGGPSETAVRSEMGGQAPWVQCASAYVIAPFLPPFYPIFTPLLPHEG